MKGLELGFGLHVHGPFWKVSVPLAAFLSSLALPLPSEIFHVGDTQLST